MAQIVTITNPLTGQPAQVDQLDHTAQQIDDAIARALPGGGIDTLLAGKAPAGYGIGSGPKEVNDDLDNYIYGGLYAWNTGVSNSPFDWGVMLVFPATNYASDTTQLAISLYPTNAIAIRRKLGGVFSPWEWVNPPMQLGVEYRTTERYQGKPVYKRLIDFGALPNSSVKEVSVPNVNVMRNISIDLSKSVCTKTGFLTTNLFPGHPSISVIYFNVGTVRIETTADYSSWSAQICISYTKSTD